MAGLVEPEDALLPPGGVEGTGQVVERIVLARPGLGAVEGAVAPLSQDVRPEHQTL